MDTHKQIKELAKLGVSSDIEYTNWLAKTYADENLQG